LGLLVVWFGGATISNSVVSARVEQEIQVVHAPELEASVASGGMSRLAAVSARLTGSEGIFMGSSRIPPGLRSSPHVHTNCESALYVVSGRGRFLTGQHLERELGITRGDFLYVPPDAPHVVVNDADEDLVLVIARNTQEEVVSEYDADIGGIAVSGPGAAGSGPASLDRPLLMNRCKSCRVPIRGPLAIVSRLRGITPYRKNPQLCTRCERRITGAEELPVTALFADIRSSTTISVERSSAEYVGILRRFFREATAVVYDSYGVVDRFLGDGMLVFFNAPVPRPRHPEDALKAALAIQERLEGAPFGVGIGIETGIVLVGDPGLGEVVDFTCVGEAVNVASRLQVLASRGEIIIGPTAWPSVADILELRHIASTPETVDIKGVGVAEIHRVRCPAEGSDRAPDR